MEPVPDGARAETHLTYLDRYEVGQRALDELIQWAETNYTGLARNEATTRMHLIDRLFFECLCWPREECVAEEPHGGTYADYIFGSTVKLLVEAKREDAYFELPAGFDRRTLQIKTLIEDDATLKALTQAIGYCRERSIPVGVISNGAQLIAFIGSRVDGVPSLDGRAVVYTSLDDIRANFRHVWDRLSKPGLESFTLYSELQGQTQTPPPEKLSRRLSNYPGFKNRNNLAIELSTLGGLVLEDIIHDPRLEAEFLEQTFCSSGALSQYALVSKEILKTRYSAFFGQEAQIQTEPVTDRKGAVSEGLTAEIIAAGLARRPIVLLGDVGVGKSMFIRHFIAVDAADVLEDAIVLQVDFGERPTLARDVEGHVARVLSAQLDEDHDLDIYEASFVRAVYNAQLNKFEHSLFGELRDDDPIAYRRKEIEMLDARSSNIDEHLPAALNHVVATHRRQVVIFLDNVDQRDAEFQDRVFVVAQSMAHTWPATVFVSLRPDTFYRSKRQGSLSAYPLRAFTIAPPRVDLVIAKRLQYARHLLDRGQLSVLGPAVTLDSPSLRAYLDALLMSLKANDQLVELIENLSGGNVRRALEFIQAFVGSGHVDSQQIVDLMDEQSRYIIPVHHFLRAIIYGDHVYFDPSVSPIANLFDISTHDGREHFLLPILLTHIQEVGHADGDEGFVPAATLYEHCERLGFTASQISHTLRRAVEKDLAEAMPPNGGVSADKRYRMTTIGAYSVQRLIGSFAYADAMIDDTPIVDRAYAEQFHDAQPVLERLHRADLFRRYLDSEWVPLGGRATSFSWADASAALAKEIRNVQRRVEEQIAASER